MTRARVLIAVVGSLLAILVSAILFACSQTPTSVPVRTFERAQRMDVACMQLYDPADGFQPREPLGRPQEACIPVPADLDGTSFPAQLFAFVTQTTRGELAVVNLSAGSLVDQSKATPGINFLPVGALPTDVATTPDGKMAFVGSAEANKPAIYGVPTRRLLGDTDDRFPRDPEPVSIASWPVCALPQNPGALAVVPRRAGAAPDAGAPSDAGASDAGAGDAGAVTELPALYDLVVVLPGDRVSSAKIVTIDPRPFLRGGLRKLKDGTPDYESDHLKGEPATLNGGPILEPGSLAPCPILSAVELSGAPVLPKSFVPGPGWDDGVKYRDGGVDLTCLRPQDPTCGLRPCCDEPTPPQAPPVDAGDGGNQGVPVTDAGACEPVTPKDAGPVPLDLGPVDAPQLVSVARDDQMLYVADLGVPLIHVLDMSTPGSPRELPPLLATSMTDPSRTVKVKQLAISPPTRDYKRYLYAVDQIDGSIIVYDVTDPMTMQRTPLTRPHPELNPFQPQDRISFSSPVVAVQFARHDVPLSQINGVSMPSSSAGLLCNPNHNLDSRPQDDLGYYYRASSTDPGQEIGPRRLRGVFAFATLSNGTVLVVDVDDWDSPCRRPSDMSVPLSDITPAEPAPSGPNDLDPYHSPNPRATGIPDDPAVTQEAFFPMASPHSLRSEVLVRSDTTTGNQLPRVQGSLTITKSEGVILPQTGEGSATTPLMQVGFATEEPQVHIDQDWAVTYEGALPGFEGISATLSTDDEYRSLLLSQDNARFCAKGVEDWSAGIARTQSVAVALGKRGVALPPRTERQVADYVQLTEEILDAGDSYWDLPQECWDPRLSTANARHDACVSTYKTAAEENRNRDFPIIEAYDKTLRLGRFFNGASGREVVNIDPSNAPDLKLMRCCFHNLVKFKVRTGALWSVVGSTVGGGAGVGFLSHLTTDSNGRCVSSCDPRESLLNGRLFTAPGQLGLMASTTTAAERSFDVAKIDRNSSLAMRNPMIDLRILGSLDGTPPPRDARYSFSTRGQFRALFVSIGGASIQVNPQSMRYIESLGQMAVVDGASQGLVLIDLRAVTVARAPYF